MVASDLPAVRDLISPESGRLAVSGDVNSLVRTISKAIADGPEKNVNSRLRHFGWESVGDRYAALIESLIAKRY